MRGGASIAVQWIIGGVNVRERWAVCCGVR